jgi:hypothetical protein
MFSGRWFCSISVGGKALCETEALMWKLGQIIAIMA